MTRASSSAPSLAPSALLAAFALLPMPLAAQGIPRPPTREEVERPRPPPALPGPARLSVEGGVERSPCALEAPEFAAIRFTLKDVAFEGLKGLPAEALRRAWEPYVGTEQPIAIVCEIRDRAATILRDAGYVAAVEVPEQRIADGRLRLRVLMAKLVAIHVRGDAGREERAVARYLEPLKQAEAFNRFEAERYLLLASDLPGLDVRLRLRSAEAAPGEVVGEVSVERTPLMVEANVQNYGSHEIGPWGGLVRAELYGLTGLGDRTSLAFYSTADFSEQQTLQIGHDMRLGGEGFTLSGRFTYAWADPELADPSLHVRAHTLLATGEARYPVVRRQAASVWAAAGLDWIDQRVRLNGLPLSLDKLRVAFARLDFALADAASFGDRPGYNGAEPRWRAGGGLEFRKGLSMLGASEACGPGFARCIAPGAVPPSHLEGRPDAAVARLDAAVEYRPVPRLAFSLGIKGQASGQPLLSFEEYAAGNYTVGRGYDPGVLLGDKGLGVQAEIRWGSQLPARGRRWAVQPFAFFDYAAVANNDRTFTSPGPQHLASAGGGVRAVWEDRGQIEVALAVPLQRAGLLARAPDPRLLVSFTTRLTPWRMR
ncbi:MAG: ShlB/FhaC/HecB family hemolysin secretion/activation protein [Allosphingosinicella sp.]